MRWYVTAIGLMLLMGCSQTKVHLYAKYLSNAEITRISQVLEQDDFSVDVNQLVYPESITQDSLVYSLMLKTPSELARLTQSVAKLGYNIHQEVPLFSNNHSFTHGSIGLFLIPDNIDIAAFQAQQSVIGRYYSKQCAVDTQLTLSPDKSYSLINADGQGLISGFWTVTQYPYIQLSGPKKHPWVAPYEIEVREEVEYSVPVVNIYLMPLSDYKRFNQCQFYKGTVR